jgi:hypothetical protein
MVHKDARVTAQPAPPPNLLTLRPDRQRRGRHKRRWGRLNPEEAAFDHDRPSSVLQAQPFLPVLWDGALGAVG